MELYFLVKRLYHLGRWGLGGDEAALITQRALQWGLSQPRGTGSPPFRKGNGLENGAGETKKGREISRRKKNSCGLNSSRLSSCPVRIGVDGGAWVTPHPHTGNT